MKRFGIVLLLLGLIGAFSTSAMAVDVQVSGDFYVAGVYLDKTTLTEGTAPDGTGTEGPSTAFYYQRLQVRTEFVIDPGLKLVTRFNAMERVWGANRSEPGVADPESIATRAENENIAFNLAYVQFVSAVGLFQVGYIFVGYWGTVLMNNVKNGPAIGGINYILPVGKMYFTGCVAKGYEGGNTAIYDSNARDSDTDIYQLTTIYGKNTDLEAGLAFQYIRRAANKPLPGFGNVVHLMGFAPYFKAKYGPVYMEGEFVYGWGEAKFEDPDFMGDDIKIRDHIMAYLYGLADLGMFYMGGTFAYISGDDPGTTHKK